MNDREIRMKVYEIFDRTGGIDTKVISHLFSLAGALAGEDVTIQQVRKEFIELDNLLDEVRELVRPEWMKQWGAEATRFKSEGDNETK